MGDALISIVELQGITIRKQLLHYTPSYPLIQITNHLSTVYNLFTESEIEKDKGKESDRVREYERESVSERVWERESERERER